MRKMSALGWLLHPPYPTRSYLPCSKEAIAVDSELVSRMSTWTAFSVGLGEPHQLGTATKSADCLAVCWLILKAPVPTRVAGTVHQSRGLVWMTFWSTIIPVVDSSVMADRNQPAADASLT